MARFEPLEERALLSTASVASSTWVPLGPAPIVDGYGPGVPVSGRITALAADPTDPNTIYIAAASGGVWKTTDGGTDWTPLTDNQVTNVMGALTLDPNNPQVIYAGTGEANNSADSMYGQGILKSTDGGQTWTLLGNSVFGRRAISKIVVDPSNSNTIYATDTGTLNGNALPGNRGVWKSIDGGQTWNDTTASISTTANYSDLVIDPANPQILFAAVGQDSGDAANGVYATLNGGQSWALAGNFPAGIVDGRIALALAPSDPNTIYASIAGSGQTGSVALGSLFGMYKTTDGGSQWVNLPYTPDYLTPQGWYDTDLIVDPHDPNIVYAGGTSENPGPTGNQLAGVIATVNGGDLWYDISVGIDLSSPHVDQHAIGFDADGRLLIGNDGGIWRDDGPRTVDPIWTDLNGNLNTIQFVGIALDPTNPNIAYGGSQDNGTSQYQGGPGWHQIIGGDGGFVQVDPNSPSTIYQEFYGISLDRSDDRGVTFQTAFNGIDLSDPPYSQDKAEALVSAGDPANFYVPYVLDPTVPNRLLLGTTRVYESTDKGDNWAPISPFLTGDTQADVIDSIGVAPSDVNTIYASAHGEVFVTTDHGAHWNEADNGLPTNTSPQMHFEQIVVDPHNAQTAYIVAARFGDLTGGGHVWKTTNGGQSWTDISGNLPDLPTWSIALDSVDNVLYVGNDVGVYTSSNGGTTWSQLGAGLPAVRVKTLDLEPNLNILAAGTYGRGLWEIPVNITGGHSPIITDANLSPSGQTVVEGSPVAFSGSFTDPDVGDSHVVTIDWGDGLADTTLNLKPGVFTFATSHTYLSSVPNDVVVHVTVADQLGLRGFARAPLTIQNVAPSNIQLSLKPGTLFETGSTQVTATFSDPGTLDSHIADISWGDGSPDTILTLGPGVLTFSSSHQYLDGAANGTSEPITVRVRDVQDVAYSAQASTALNAGLQPGQPGVFPILDNADDGAIGVDLGASTFTYYGTQYTGSNELFVSSNGLITFGLPDPSSWYVGTPAPPMASIAPLWDDWRTDLNPNDQVLGQFEYNSQGVPTALIIEWYKVNRYPDTPLPVTFEAILSLNTGTSPGSIQFNYLDLNTGDPTTSEGANSFVFLKNDDTLGGAPLLIAYDGIDPSPLVGTGEAINLTAVPNWVAATTSAVVYDLAPTASLNGPSKLGPGLAGAFTFSATDPSPVDQQAGFTFQVNWGDGSPVQTILPGKPGALSHVYTSAGTFSVQVTAIDKDGVSSRAASQQVAIAFAGLIPDPTNPSRLALDVVGTPGNDNIQITAGTSGTISVTENGTTLGPFSPTGLIIAQGGAGNDTITVSKAVTRSVVLNGGDGNDTLTSGGGPSVLIGGAGNDILNSTASPSSVLIADAGTNTLNGGANALLVSGSTIYTQSTINLPALVQILNEWSRATPLSVRVNHIVNGGGLNGSYVLNASTITVYAAPNVLTVTGNQNLVFKGFYDKLPPGLIGTVLNG